MKINSNYKYTKSHEWAEKLDDGRYRIGITNYAQHSLGDLVYVNMPSEGEVVEIRKAFAEVESVKAVAELFSPVSGRICAVNEALSDTPGLLNSEPYDSWIIIVAEVTATEKFLTSEEYEEYCQMLG